MTRETFIIIVKALFTGVGSFLIGKNLLGSEVNAAWWETALGAVLAAVSIVWSIRDKEYNIEKLQASFRQVLLFAGGLLVSWGKITAEQLNSIIGALLIVLPALQSYVSKNKVKRLQEHTIQPTKMASIPTKAEQKKRKAV